MKTALFMLLGLLSHQEEAEKVYAAVGPSVVRLENAEGSGTGIVIDDKGTILTNAHVITSPLPFQVKVELPKGGVKETWVYKRVDLVGVHPRYDLALVRINPKENPAKLKAVKLSREKPNPGRKVYAIGNPSGGGRVLAKTITEGMLSGERDLDGLKYWQFSAQVNPGNSGGPLCDKKGEILGLVTFKLTEVDGIGFAVPLQDFKAGEFVPLKKRGADPQAAREYLDAAEKFNRRAEELGRTYGLDDERRHGCNFLAALCFREALLYDPGNPDIYYNTGMLWRTLNEDRIAVAYLVRSIRLQPWPEHNPEYPYRELGFSLVKLGRRAEARIAWSEGIAKFPSASGKIWEDLAIFLWEDQSVLEAAYAACMALRLGNTREDIMKQLYADAKARCKPDEVRSLEQREMGLEKRLKEMQTASEEARKKRRDALDKNFEDLLKKLEGE